MNLSFYTAAVGAQQQQDRLDVHANNIANVNTNGFRARIPAFSALMTGPIKGIDEDLPRGVGSRLEDAEADQRPAGLNGTGRVLDFAIRGKGFFALLDSGTQEVSYTRDGSFALMQVTLPADPEAGTEERQAWFLSDGFGRYVLGRNGGPIEIQNPQELESLPMGEVIPDIGIFDFINYNGMTHVSENRMTPAEKNGQVGLGTGELIQGYLELSNADLANELAKVIESQRSFQYMLRMVTTSDEIETTVNNLR